MAAPVVVILAAGQGTRMRSRLPKLLHPLCGRPMIWWPVQAAREAGAGRVVVVDSPERPLRDAVQGLAEIVVQEQPRGTADAVRAAGGLIDPEAPVIVLLGDGPLIRPETLRALNDLHGAEGAAATIVTAVLQDPSGYGRVVRAPDGTVERVVETKHPGDASAMDLEIREVNTGAFAFDAQALLTALEEVRSDNAQGELYLPDVLPVLRRHERTVVAYEMEDPDELLGVNDRRALAAVRAVAQRMIIERHQLAGVTVVDPQATVIDVEVEIGPDSVIEPFTCLHGRTRIGSETVVGPHSTLHDARVGDGSRVLHSHVVEATIEDRVSVGPFAYLRPGTVLRTGSKAGTFVEIKNSDVGSGTKVPHLSYIGDAEIGEGTNLGAATITANYDGYRKNRTQIGSRVRTGVDTTLVAPVSLADEAVTAAGSVIGQDVPEGALAGSPGVARSAQRNVEGYADRRRARAEAEARAAEASQQDDHPPAG
ncbi:MAG TPA: bifunctional UDP-N-acetylglucosamine diphosphorylase/glucosamine-1-phosphate N-acetyltransferase GlmU [Solirubrobacteraceae bacterium]|nr:bifunctional UDP-N-acetylglucosamine diphosphorylase/glucosamine-1-phosphate N-acetyltransferase GlmU [Solirubrobacteraceae bacterium]